MSSVIPREVGLTSPFERKGAHSSNPSICDARLKLQFAEVKPDRHIFTSEEEGLEFCLLLSAVDQVREGRLGELQGEGHSSVTEHLLFTQRLPCSIPAI